MRSFFKEMAIQDMHSSVAANLHIFIPILQALITLVVVYSVLMARAVIDMLRYDAHGLLLTFALLVQIPFPLDYRYGHNDSYNMALS